MSEQSEEIVPKPVDVQLEDLERLVNHFAQLVDNISMLLGIFNRGFTETLEPMRREIQFIDERVRNAREALDLDEGESTDG